MIAFEYASAKPPLLPETSNIPEQILWFILAICHVNGDTQIRQIKKGKGWSLSLIMYRQMGFWSPSEAYSCFQDGHWHKGALVIFCAPRKGFKKRMRGGMKDYNKSNRE